MERKYLIETIFIRLDIKDMPCPACKSGTLKEYNVIGAGLKEMLKEIANPWLMFRVYYKMYLGTVKNMAGFFPQYQCSSCKAQAAICPHCKSAWILQRALKHCERVTCPSCKVESYFTLDR